MTQQQPDETNPLDPFGLMKGARDANMEAWSKMMQQFVTTQGYSEATAKMLDTYLTTSAPFRRMFEQSMAQALTQLNMPTRADVTAVAERLTTIEMRLDDLAAGLDALARRRTASTSEGTATPPTGGSATPSPGAAAPDAARPPAAPEAAKPPRRSPKTRSK